LQAGIRVQTIKKVNRGAVNFGTEVFSSTDRSLTALLGASPGASVSVNIALEVVKTCLAHLLASNEGQERMRRMIPTFDHDLKQPRSAALFEKTSREATERLHLTGQADHNSTTLPTTSHHHEQL
jgi:malate dehydrogenase (quinone)